TCALPIFRKLHDLGENLLDLLLFQSENGTVEADIFGSGQIPAQTRPELDEGGDLSIDLHFPFVGIDDAAQDFEQRAFSRAVIAHDGKGFTLLDGEGDVFQGGEFGVPLFPLGQGDEVSLQRFVVGLSEMFGQVPDDNRVHCQITSPTLRLSRLKTPQEMKKMTIVMTMV